MQANQFHHIKVNPLSGSLGAEIFGVDLSNAPSSEVISEIRQALLDNLVIFFREQELTPQQHKAFAENFGPLSVDRFVRGL